MNNSYCNILSHQWNFCNPKVAPNSSYSLLLNHICWKLPKLLRMLPPIQVLYRFSMLFLLQITLFLYIFGRMWVNSVLSRLSIPGKSAEDPVSIMFDMSSFRISASRTWERDSCTSLCRGNAVSVPVLVRLCRQLGNDSENKSSYIIREKVSV